MKYKPEWKGRLKIDRYGDVVWDGVCIGRVISRFVDGARSPGGMVTNTVFMVDSEEFASMTQAVEFLIARDEADRRAEEVGLAHDTPEGIVHDARIDAGLED